MTTAVIVQARMGSSRLPGKVMLDLAGKPVLQHVLERCRRIPSADVVVCAMPNEEESQALAEVARKAGAECAFGSESDVLARYAAAARQVGADVVMRVTSDCPLIDPAVCELVLDLRRKDNLDYAANNMPPSFPHGLDCEAMTAAALHLAEVRTAEPFDREHVTPWLRRNSDLRLGNLLCSPRPELQHRWTLDYPEDLEFFRTLYTKFPLINDSMDSVLAALASAPEISAVNAARDVRVGAAAAK